MRTYRSLLYSSIITLTTAGRKIPQRLALTSLGMTVNRWKHRFDSRIRSCRVRRRDTGQYAFDLQSENRFGIYEVRNGRHKAMR